MRLSAPMLLLDDGRRVRRLAPLPGPDDPSPRAGPEPQTWRAAFAAVASDLKDPNVAYALETHRGMIDLPRPREIASRPTAELPDRLVDPLRLLRDERRRRESAERSAEERRKALTLAEARLNAELEARTAAEHAALLARHELEGSRADASNSAAGSARVGERVQELEAARSEVAAALRGARLDASKMLGRVHAGHEAADDPPAGPLPDGGKDAEPSLDDQLRAMLAEVGRLSALENAIGDAVDAVRRATQQLLQHERKQRDLEIRLDEALAIAAEARSVSGHHVRITPPRDASPAATASEIGPLDDVEEIFASLSADATMPRVSTDAEPAVPGRDRPQVGPPAGATRSSADDEYRSARQPDADPDQKADVVLEWHQPSVAPPLHDWGIRRVETRSSQWPFRERWTFRVPPPIWRSKRLPRSRLLLLAAVAAALVVATASLAGLDSAVLWPDSQPPVEEQRAQRFVADWARGDYTAMYSELTDGARRAITLDEFTKNYRSAAGMATATAFAPGTVGKLRSGSVTIPMRVSTRAFGTVRATLRLPFADTGGQARIAWSQNLTFPGVDRGERLHREVRLARRADVLARDGTPLARGDGSGSPLGPAAAAIGGTLGKAPRERVERIRERGVPGDALVGVSGLQRVFDEDLAGRPGGSLIAGDRVLAASEPHAAQAIRTTIDPAVQQAAFEALGSRSGAIAALRPESGEIIALTGDALTGLHPVGSAFSMITLAGALAAQLAGRRSKYPRRSAVKLNGLAIANASGQPCGGSLALSFARACAQVFATLGARLGPARLVKTAEAFGFNSGIGILGARTSTIAVASDAAGVQFASGSAAIGRGVSATALQMAWTAATISEGGIRTALTLRPAATRDRKRVLPAGTAGIVGNYMETFMKTGNAVAATVPGVRVAGVSGTAQSASTSTIDCTPSRSCAPSGSASPGNVGSWFAGYAPARSTTIAASVHVAGPSAADEAAIAGQKVLLAGLKQTN